VAAIAAKIKKSWKAAYRRKIFLTFFFSMHQYTNKKL